MNDTTSSKTSTNPVTWSYDSKASENHKQRKTSKQHINFKQATASLIAVCLTETTEARRQWSGTFKC
jgi:hypothetical protein